MSRLKELIDELCPNGVEYKNLWEVTVWDKKFNGVDKQKQPKTISYKYYLSSEFDKVERDDGDIYYISTGISGKDRYTKEEVAKEYVHEGEVVCIPWGGTPNVKYYKGKFVTGDNRIATSIDTSILDNKFLYYWMQNSIKELSSYYRGSGIKHPSMAAVLDMKVPVPPLEVQHEIVHILDDFTLLSAELSAELKARQKQYEYFRDKLLDFEEAETLDTLHTHTHGYFYRQEIKCIKLGEVGNVCMCKRIMKNQTNVCGTVPFYKIGTFGKVADAYISKELYEEYKEKYSYPKKGDILISASGTIGRTVIYNGESAYFQDSNIVWIDNDEKIVKNKFLYYLYQIIEWNVEGGTIKRLYNENLKDTVIKVPSLEIQCKIIEILEKFEKLVNDIQEGLPAEIEARQKQYEYYRDKILNFKTLE